MKYFVTVFDLFTKFALKVLGSECNEEKRNKRQMSQPEID